MWDEKHAVGFTVEIVQGWDKSISSLGLRRVGPYLQGWATVTIRLHPYTPAGKHRSDLLLSLSLLRSEVHDSALAINGAEQALDDVPVSITTHNLAPWPLSRNLQHAGRINRAPTMHA